MASYDPRVYQNYYPSHPGLLHHHAGYSGSTAPIPHETRRPPSLLADTKPEAKKPGWLQFYRTAQSIAFPEASAVCGDAMAGYLEDLARAIGCPLEYVLVPLLPCVGGLLGTSTTVRVHKGWSEPAILWSIVCAGPGARRSAVIRQLLAPILALQATRSKESTVKKSKIGKTEEKESDDDQPKRRALYSGTRINAAALTEVLHRNDGHAFSLTENVEHLHDMLGLLAPAPPPRMVSVMEDLYEGLPLVAVEDGRVTTILGSNFCHGGFASPEYAVQLMLRSPTWLSSRLLLACPQTDDMKAVFGEPASDSTHPDLFHVYAAILDHHEQPCQYSYSAEALQELSRFFDEDWSTVLSQLDQAEHEDIIGKSMGQIVRVSAVVKALANGVQAAGEGGGSRAWDWVIDLPTVCCAISLGKYFMEQKLSMTFNVGGEFFSGKSGKDLSQSVNGDGADFPDTDSLAGLGGRWVGASGGANFGPDGGDARDVRVSCEDVSSSPVPGKVAKTSMFDSPSSSGREDIAARHAPGVDFSVLPVTLSTPEEDLSGMRQQVDFVHYSSTQFVATHGRRIKRLLECYDDGHGVSATIAAQKSITPPVRLEGTNNRHPAWASALFFQKVAELKLGTAEQGRHPTNRKVCWRFKRKPPAQLSDKDRQLLDWLRVDMDKYSMFGSSLISNPAAFGAKKQAGLLDLLKEEASPQTKDNGQDQSQDHGQDKGQDENKERSSSPPEGMNDDGNSQHSCEEMVESVKAEDM